MSVRPRGALVWEGPSPVNGAPIFAAITGLRGTSHNVKTGPMAQVWILHQEVAPLEYRGTGADEAVCGGCPQRHHLGGGCYVVPRHGPQAVFHTYREGGYAPLEPDWLDGVHVRFGAYGDPAMVPMEAWSVVLGRAVGWTGYTNQWHPDRLDLDPEVWAAWLMASCKDHGERELARSRGWRTYRGRPAGTTPGHGEIGCPAAHEAPTHGSVTCIDCGLCDGHATQAKDISIVVHGPRANFFEGQNPSLFGATP